MKLFVFTSTRSGDVESGVGVFFSCSVNSELKTLQPTPPSVRVPREDFWFQVCSVFTGPRVNKVLQFSTDSFYSRIVTS